MEEIGAKRIEGLEVEVRRHNPGFTRDAKDDVLPYTQTARRTSLRWGQETEQLWTCTKSGVELILTAESSVDGPGRDGKRLTHGTRLFCELETHRVKETEILPVLSSLLSG